MLKIYFTTATVVCVGRYLETLANLVEDEAARYIRAEHKNSFEVQIYESFIERLELSRPIPTPSRVSRRSGASHVSVSAVQCSIGGRGEARKVPGREVAADTVLLLQVASHADCTSNNLGRAASGQPSQGGIRREAWPSTLSHVW